jgi:hypothetical protein
MSWRELCFSAQPCWIPFRSAKHLNSMLGRLTTLFITQPFQGLSSYRRGVPQIPIRQRGFDASPAYRANQNCFYLLFLVPLSGPRETLAKLVQFEDQQ